VVGVVAPALVALQARYRHALWPTSVHHDFDVVWRHHLPPGAKPDLKVPLARDYGFLGVVVLTVVSVPVMFTQWMRIESLPYTLARDGLVRSRVVSPDRFEAVVKEFCRRNRRTIWDLVSLAFGLVVAGFVYLSARRHGVYPYLDRRHAVDMAQRHYDYWWANVAHHPAGAIAFMFVVGFYAALQFRHNVLGYWVIRLLRDLGGEQPNVADAEGWFGYNSEIALPDVGLAAIRAALRDIFVSVIMGEAVVGLAVYTVAFPAYLVRAIVVYVIVLNVFVFVVPSIYLSTQLGNARVTLRRNLRATPEEAGFLERDERIRAFPAGILDYRWLPATVVTYVLPILTVFHLGL
jgi:hypothetical protein